MFHYGINSSNVRYYTVVYTLYWQIFFMATGLIISLEFHCKVQSEMLLQNNCRIIN